MMMMRRRRTIIAISVAILRIVLVVMVPAAVVMLSGLALKQITWPGKEEKQLVEFKLLRAKVPKLQSNSNWKPPVQLFLIAGE